MTIVEHPAAKEPDILFHTEVSLALGFYCGFPHTVSSNIGTVHSRPWMTGIRGFSESGNIYPLLGCRIFNCIMNYTVQSAPIHGVVSHFIQAHS